MNYPNAQAKRDSENALSSELVYQGKKINIRIDRYESNQKEKLFELVEHPGAVVLLPVDEKGRVLFIRQWRKAIGEILLELPAGTLEKGEDAFFCSQRELQEEIGFRSNRLTHITDFYTAPGFCNEKMQLFLAEELFPSTLEADEDEGIDLEPLSMQETLLKIQDGDLIDAKSIAAIFYYELWLKTKRS